MRYGVLADVHGNLPALEAAIRRLESEGVDGWLCAGDLVGYGPFPNECVARVGDLAMTCVAGNHDLIALGELSDERCIPSAQATLAWTRRVLDGAARDYLASLPILTTTGDVTVTHASLEDPQVYVRQPEDALAELAGVGRFLVAGHTHRPLVVRDAEKLFLNPGAVGQSRELRLRARCAVLDTVSGTCDLFELRYDTRSVDRELARHGLPRRTYHLRPSPVRRLRRFLRR